MSPRQRRVRALVALVLFVVGSWGWPLADALLLHHDSLAFVPHIESTDGTDCHGQRCVLGHQLPTAVPADAPVDTPRLASIVLRHDGLRDVVAPPAHLTRAPLGSRAPPTPH
jgi:predicted exporter